jgi:hypothetical protein
MKKIVTDSGVYGPFKTVLVEDGLYIADGTRLFFSVIGAGDVQDAVAGDFPVPSYETPEQTIKRLEAAVDAHVDAVAQSRGYRDIVSLCSYAASAHPVFGPEGQAGIVFRDAVWQACLDIMADVMSEQRPVPTEEELIAELPAMQWPHVD